VDSAGARLKACETKYWDWNSFWELSLFQVKAVCMPYRLSLVHLSLITLFVSWFIVLRPAFCYQSLPFVNFTSLPDVFHLGSPLHLKPYHNVHMGQFEWINIKANSGVEIINISMASL